MRPVRITLQDRTYDEFYEDLNKCFAGATLSSEDRLKVFYERMLQQYRIIILDMDTSNLLMGLTYGSGWILCEEFVKQTPTPSTLDAYLEKQAEQEASHDMDFDNAGNSKPEPKKFRPDEDVFNRIIEKVGVAGSVEMLSRGEREYLNLVAKFYRDNGHIG